MEATHSYSTKDKIENLFSVSVLVAMALLPVVEIIGRKLLGRGIPGSIPLVEHLTLWIAFLGAALATRSDRMLALSTVSFLPEAARNPVRIFTGAVGAGVAAWLAWASFDLVRFEYEAPTEVAMGIRVWMAMCIMPAAFGLIAFRLIWHSSDHGWGRLLAGLGLALPIGLGFATSMQGGGIVLPIAVIILAATLLGMPIFATLGGLALLFFWNDFVPAAAVPVETYRLTAHPMLPAIPLFTFGGYILSEGGASKRLMKLFTAWVGWIPGGLAIMTTFVLAFFTPLTGASGVTILSMGGLLKPVLERARYPERFSVGLVTVSGSIGLLLPLSLPVILYAVTARVSVADLFLGALLPGLLLILMVAAWGFRQGLVSGIERQPFVLRKAVTALWEARCELLLPVVILVGIIGGFTTWVEAAAITVLYAFVVEFFIYKDLSVRKDTLRIAIETATLVGGFLIILGMALGFTNYLIQAEIPMQALAWVQSHIDSPLVFLLVLNVFLLAVGGLMDIYSAIFVVVPLIIPIAAAYGINPVHLGIIFLANLELGYLTPPMGENLFLSSFRFNQPLTAVFRSIVPFWLILMAGVLLITYFPPLTLTLVELFGGGP